MRGSVFGNMIFSVWLRISLINTAQPVQKYHMEQINTWEVSYCEFNSKEYNRLIVIAKKHTYGTTVPQFPLDQTLHHNQRKISVVCLSVITNGLRATKHTFLSCSSDYIPLPTPFILVRV